GPGKRVGGLTPEQRLDGLSDEEIECVLAERKAQRGCGPAGSGATAGRPGAGPGTPGRLFRLDQAAATFGTSWRGDVELPPACVVGRFGRSGIDRDGTGHWSFVNVRDEVFTLYRLRGVSEDFWTLSEPRVLSIGGQGETDVLGFRRWLVEQVLEFQRTGQRGPDVPEEFGRAYVLEHLRDLSPEERL